MTKAQRLEILRLAREFARIGEAVKAREAFALVGISYVPAISN